MRQGKMADEQNGEGDSMLKTTETTAVIMTSTSQAASPSTNHERNMKKFVLACVVFQGIFLVLYLAMARYDVSADARYWKAGTLVGIDNENISRAVTEDLKKNLEKYPCT